MSTILQKNLANEIVKNSKRKKPLNKGELLEIVGYKKSVAKAKPTEILEQVGVRDALNELGFNENTAKGVVKEIMLNPKEKSENRLKASDQVFKVFGSYTNPEGTNNTQINIFISETLNRKHNANNTPLSSE